MTARDIQGMEMVPFGPMNGKSFGTSISPWIITLEALAPFKTSAPVRNPEVELSPYLQDPDPKSSFDIGVEVSLHPADSVSSTVCKSKFSSMYWTVKDMVAQQTINGCSLNTGDLLATGTISGPTLESHGCLLELSPKGGAQIKTADGGNERRMFLKDGDTVSLSASAGSGVGFGECVGTILKAKD
jgi:fumarylacetoacetase